MAKQKAPRTPGAVSPWTAKKHAEMTAQPDNRPFIYLLTDVTGCELLLDGIVPEYLARQAEDALKWQPACTPPVVPELQVEVKADEAKTGAAS